MDPRSLRCCRLNVFPPDPFPPDPPSPSLLEPLAPPIPPPPNSLADATESYVFDSFPSISYDRFRIQTFERET